LVFFGYFFTRVHFGPAFEQPDSLQLVGGQKVGNSQAVAWSLYTQQLLPFEVASVFLLIAMVGAVVLGRRR
jgi:NADH:ubiquinone oxidoreductase subunit 6 (subunit J)